MSDKFSIDDILAEFGEEKNEKNAQKPQVGSDNIQTSKPSSGATMILRSIDEKKSLAESKTDTKEILPKSSSTAKENTVQNNTAKNPAAGKNGVSDTPAVRKSAAYKSLSEFEEAKAPAKSRPAQTAAPKRTEGKPHSTASSAMGGNVRKKTSAANATIGKTSRSGSGTKNVAKNGNKSDDKVAINSSPNMTFADKIKQYRFLFEELTKRDFKKKYKRAFLGVLWSVISPFMTFLVQFFIFGYIFRRQDTQYVIYLLSGTLMYSFFTNATTTGMFTMYSNGSILSKVKVPKSLFILSSNFASIFNFLLTLIVYFVFMIFCHVNFGLHLLAMLFPIICLTIFNIGMSYILSALFVFFRDMQYLYQIFTTLLMYMSATFYEITRFPENLRFIFDVNPIYQFISYLRQVVIYSSIPDLTTHLICLCFSFGILGIGYFVHKKTEQKFVYYY